MGNHKPQRGLIWRKPAGKKLPGGVLGRALLVLAALLASPITTAASTNDASPAADSADTVTVGILAPRGDAHSKAQWQATLAALNRAVPRAHFAARPMTLDAITSAVANASVDFVLTNPGQFVLLETPYALSWLATLRSNPARSAREALGSVLLVRRDAPYERVRQLVGRRVVAVHEQAFGGYLLLLPELEAAGVSPNQLDLAFLGYPVDALVYQLRDGQAEAAIMPVCMLEQMAQEGLIEADRFRALLPADPLGGCLASTPAYPDWTFAALPHVSEALAADVARALLSMDDPAAASWGAPVSAASVATLFDDLRLHPLRDSLTDRLTATLMRYWHYTAFAGLLVLAALLYHGWVQHKAYQHSRALKTTQLALRERERELAGAQNLNVSGELAATLAHELNQPLAAIRHYAEGGQLRLARESPDSALIEPLQRIDNEAARGARIIEQARQWIRREPPQFECLTIATLLHDVAALAEPRRQRLGVELTWTITPQTLTARGNRLAMEQVLGNLIANSLDAFDAIGRSGWIHCEAWQEAGEGTTRLRLRDNAGGFSEDRLAQPFAPLQSSRAEGLGLGLVISRRLMARQQGTIALGNHAGGGAEIQLTLPAMPSEGSE